MQIFFRKLPPNKNFLDAHRIWSWSRVLSGNFNSLYVCIVYFGNDTFRELFQIKRFYVVQKFWITC